MTRAAKTVFEEHLKNSGLPESIKEYQFHKTRKWAFDYAWPDIKLAFELEGGAFVRGRHTRPKGFTEDIVKYNEAQLLGWVVLRATSAQVKDGYAIKWIMRFFRGDV